jgi:hypothetical protein
MMDKKILIGGGIAAVVVIGFVIVKMRSTPAPDESYNEASMMPDTGYFSGLGPVSGGASSGGAPSVAGNSGSTDEGGGFDIGSLFAKMFESQAETNQLSIITGGYNYDSAVLASIVGADGSANVTHGAGGTTVTNTPGADAYQKIVDDLYKTNLGRAADTAGSAYWKNALMNQNLSINSINDLFKSSSEYQNKNSSVQLKPTAIPPPITTRTEEKQADGSTVVTVNKIQT